MMLGFDGRWVFQWFEFFKLKQWNWVNFDFCHVGLEVCWFEGKHVECVFVILGLGFWLEWDNKASRDHIKKLAEEISERVKNA